MPEEVVNTEVEVVEVVPVVDVVEEVAQELVATEEVVAEETETISE